MKYLYHGTRYAALKSILKNGLIPSSKARFSNLSGQSIDVTWFSDNLRGAMWYAQHGYGGTNSPVILRVRKSDVTAIKADDDAEGGGTDYIVKHVIHPKYIEIVKQPTSGRPSSVHRNPVVYHGSPNRITGLLKLSGMEGIGGEMQIPGIYFTDSIEYARFFAIEPWRTSERPIHIKEPTITIADIRPRKMVNLNEPAPRDFRQMIIQSAIENGVDKDEIEEIESHLNNDSLNDFALGTAMQDPFYEEENIDFFADDLKSLGYDCVSYIDVGSRMGRKGLPREEAETITNYIVLDSSIIKIVDVVSVPAPLEHNPSESCEMCGRTPAKLTWIHGKDAPYFLCADCLAVEKSRVVPLMEFKSLEKLGR